MLKNNGGKRFTFPTRRNIKRNQPEQKLEDLTPEQLAKNNLIEISNLEFDTNQLVVLEPQQSAVAHQSTPSTPVSKFRYKTPIRIRRKNNMKNSISQEIQSNKSAQIRMSVTERMTESFKAGIKPQNSEVQTDHVCVLKRKLPINLSHYLLLDNRNPRQCEITQKIVYRPKPSINSRTYFKHKKQGITREEDIKQEENASGKLEWMRRNSRKLSNQKDSPKKLHQSIFKKIG